MHGPARAAARPLLASQEENEWPREDHTNPFAQAERTGIVRVHQKSQDQPGAKVEPTSRRTTAPDRHTHAVQCRRRRETAAAATSVSFPAQLRQSLFFGQPDVGVTQLTFAGLASPLEPNAALWYWE